MESSAKLAALRLLSRELLKSTGSREQSLPWETPWGQSLSIMLVREAEHLTAGMSPEFVDELREAIESGPAALAKLKARLSEELALSATVAERVSQSELRVRCFSLRHLSLQHLTAIFSATRVDP